MLLDAYYNLLAYYLCRFLIWLLTASYGTIRLGNGLQLDADSEAGDNDPLPFYLVAKCMYLLLVFVRLCLSHNTKFVIIFCKCEKSSSTIC